MRSSEPSFVIVEKQVSKESALQVYQRCIRTWVSVLTPFEFTVAMHIIDRTLGWGKTRVSVSTDRMRNGDRDWGKGRVYEGMKMGRTAMFDALSSLEAKGVIARHATPGKNIRTYSVNLGWSPSKLNIPNRLQISPPDGRFQSVKRTVPVRQTVSGERILEKEVREKEDYAEPAAQRTVDPSDLVIRARQEVSARRAAKPRPMSLKGMVDAAQDQWRAGVSETHPTGAVLAWNVREVAMVKAKAKGWLFTKRISFPEFIGWCARNWAGVCRVQLKWMSKSAPPKAPNIGFLVSFIDHFAEAWASGDLDMWMAEGQRTEYERLVALGHSHDEALHQMAKTDAQMAMRDEVRKKTDAANRTLREAQIAAARAERMGTAMPIHPKSPLAAKMRAEQAVNPPARQRRMKGEDDPKAIDWGNLPTLDPNWEPPL